MPGQWLEKLSNSPALGGPPGHPAPIAVDLLREGCYNLLPIELLQQHTNNLVLSKNKAIQPRTQTCDDLLRNEISRATRGQWPHQELAIISSLHAFTHEGARGHVALLMHDPERYRGDHDHSLGYLTTYLQCIVVGHVVRSEVFDQDEHRVASTLLSIVTQRDRSNFKYSWLWTILRRIRTDENFGFLTSLFPAELVIGALKCSSFASRFAAALAAFSQSMAWYDALALLFGIDDVWQDKACRKVIRSVIPDAEVWAPWRPDKSRIWLWKSSATMASFREELKPLLELEGPDTTGKQNGTYKDSSPGYFEDLAAYAPGYGTAMAENALKALDRALKRGPEAVQLVILIFFSGSKDISRRKLDQANAVLDLRSESYCFSICQFLREMQIRDEELGSKPEHLCEAISSALPIIGSLQRRAQQSGQCPPFADEAMLSELSQKALRGLQAAQHQFLRWLATLEVSPDDTATHARCKELLFVIASLARALLDTYWLHYYMNLGLAELERLRGITGSHQDALRALDIAKTAIGLDRYDCINFVAKAIGGA